MWCTTECWNCEDKTCEHYFSKQDIYFKYNQLQSNWNSLREWLEVNDRYSQGYFKQVLEYMNELEGNNNGIMD